MNQSLYDFNAYLIGVTEWAMTDDGKAKLGEKAAGAKEMLLHLQQFSSDLASGESQPVIKSVIIKREN